MVGPGAGFLELEPRHPLCLDLLRAGPIPIRVELEDANRDLISNAELGLHLSCGEQSVQACLEPDESPERLRPCGWWAFRGDCFGAYRSLPVMAATV